VAFGTSHGRPLADATLRFGPVGGVDDARRLWSQHGAAEVRGRHLEVDRTLYRRPNGAFLLTGNPGPFVEIDQTSSTITVDEGDVSVQLQLLAAFAFPLILHATASLLVHGSACARDDQTLVICGDSGAGKSSLLVGLVDAGWTAVTEDLCTVDLRGEQPMVWPGPPWVRIAHGRAGPIGARPRFETGDKTAWDIASVQAREPRAVTQLVLLDTPGGEAPMVEAVAGSAAIRDIAHHAVWLGEQDERGRRLFRPTAEMATRVPTVRLRLPRHESWLDSVPELLASNGFVATSA
jgi:hypothetical protein